jgi:hypothetical protein
MKHAIALLLLAAGSCAFSQTVRPIKAGDVHVYSIEQKTDRARYDESVSVVAVEGDRVKVKHTRSDKEGASTEGLYTVEWAALKSGHTGTVLEPALRQVPQPLQVGAVYPLDSAGTTASGAKFRFKGEATVAAQEKLSTPAGEFDTFRIEQKGYVNGISFPGGWAFTQKIWYAPSINRIVRQEYKEQRSLGAENVYVLKSFKPAD